MSAVKDSDSASDVSSNSSWTVLDEDSSYENFRKQSPSLTNLSPGSSNDCIIIENAPDEPEKKEPDVIVINDDSTEELTSDTDTSSQSSSKGQFLTLEEYVAERAIEHDYEYDEKGLMFDEMMHKNPKQNKKKFKKTKAKTFGALSIMGAILSVAGISLLCLLTPHTAVSNSKLNETIKANFTKVSENCCADGGKYAVYLDDSKESLKLLDRLNVFSQCLNQKANSLKQQCKKEDEPVKVNNSKKPTTSQTKSKESRITKKIAKDVAAERTKALLNEEPSYGPPTFEQFIASVKPDHVETIIRETDLYKGTNPKPDRIKNTEKHTSAKTEGTKVKAAIKSESKPAIVGTCKVAESPNENSIEYGPQTYSEYFKDKTPKVKETVKKDPKVSSVGTCKKDERKTEKLTTKPSEVKKLQKIETPKVTKEKVVKKTSSKPSEDKQPINPKPPSTTPIKKENTCKKPTEDARKKIENESNYNEILNSLVEHKSPHNLFMTVLQDLILLRLTAKVSGRLKNMQKKIDSQKQKKNLDKTNFSIMSLSSKTPSATSEMPIISEVGNESGNPEKAGTQMLFKELPFNSHVLYCPSIELTRKKTCKALSSTTSLEKSHKQCIEDIPSIRNVQIRPKIRPKATNKVLKSESSNQQSCESSNTSTALSVGSSMDKKDSPLSLELQKKTRSERRKIFLEEIQKHRLRRQEILENMRKEKQRIIENMVRESKNLKDASSGTYCVPMPSASEVALKLQELKRKESKVLDSLAENFMNKFATEKLSKSNLHYKSKSTTNSLQTVQEKDPTNLGECKLKRASTLTCIKKNSTARTGTHELLLKLKKIDNGNDVEKTDSEVLKSENDRKQERHEQLKKYWKTRQKYMEKRIEICELLKNRIIDQVESNDEKKKKQVNKCIESGVHVIDRIITDVLATTSVKKAPTIIKPEEGNSSSTSVEDAGFSNRNCELQLHNQFRSAPCRDADPKTKGLYDWFFGKRGHEIYEEDRKRWHDREPLKVCSADMVKRNVFNKQDPRRSYKTKVLLNKKNL